MSEIWYSPSEINFSYHQMEWAVPHLNEMEEGNWPKMPPGYMWDMVEHHESQERLEILTQDLQSYRMLGKPWLREKVLSIAAVISERLDDAGDHGKMVRNRDIYQMTIKDLEKTHHTPYQEIIQLITLVYIYISGSKSKGNYNNWKMEYLKPKHDRGIRN